MEINFGSCSDIKPASVFVVDVIKNYGDMHYRIHILAPKIKNGLREINAGNGLIFFVRMSICVSMPKTMDISPYTPAVLKELHCDSLS